MGNGTIREVADMLGVHYITMKRWCRDGTVPSFTIGHKRFIPKQAIEVVARVSPHGRR